MLNPIDAVVAALDRAGCNPRPAGTGHWSARCPAHDDHHPSLSVAEGDGGKVLVKCHAGCPVESVVAALGLRMSDLWPDDSRSPAPNSKPKSNGKPRSQYSTADDALEDLRRRLGTESAKWEYYNTDGNLVGIVVRWDNESGKDIRPISRHSEGWQIAAMPEPRPLYRLRELLAADQSLPVVIVEGEKAADAATQCGLLAVTSVGGAQAAAKTDWSPLAGREVIILPDHDLAGEKYAEDVAALAYTAGAKEIHILRLADHAPRLPEGGDLADLLESEDYCGIGLGDTAEPTDLGQLLLGLVKDVPVWTPASTSPPLAWKPFPTAPLPEPVRSLVECGAVAMQCDPSFLALPALTVCAAAIGNTRRIRLKNGWDAPPILWTAIVGESGTIKTAAFNVAIQPVRDVEMKESKRHAEAKLRYELDLITYDKLLTDWRRGKNTGSGPPRKPKEPQAERYIVKDITVEALALLLENNPRGLLLARDELNAWLGSFDRYAAHGKADAANWLSMHVGQALIVDRKTGDRRTIIIPSAAVSITGGIQPGILRRALTQELREAGLAARFLLAYPPRIQKEWTEAEIDPAITAAYARLIETFYSWRPYVTEEGKIQPIILKLSPEAKDRYIAFYNANAKEQMELEGDLASAWSKLEEYAARLALVIHCIRVAAEDPTLDHDAVVDGASMEAAIVLTEWFKYETRRVYAILMETEEDANRRKLIEWITARGGAVTARDVQAGYRPLRGPGMAKQALGELVTLGIGRWEKRNGKEIFVLVPGKRKNELSTCQLSTCQQLGSS